MAKPKAPSQDTTPDSTPAAQPDPMETVPAQPNAELVAELERLRSEREWLLDDNARLHAAAEAATQASIASEPALGAGSGPQGIVIREMNSGDEKKDFHPKWREKRMIDPESLKVDGKDPYLALPIHGTNQVRVKRIEAGHAAYILTCDPASGGQSVYRLATDAEVAAAERDHERRRGQAERSRAKDLASQSE
jgi:hypothetical protein